MVQENSLEKKILIICGPTASGKTALAVECAKLLDSEVISADSMYIYKGLDVGTAKPTIEEMQGVKHHVISVCEPNCEFSVSDYKKIATPIVDKLISQGKIPVICGGTGFYINSLLYDLSYGNSSANLEAREKYKKLAEENGNEHVYKILQEVDPESAEKLHFNDVKRVIRALEIYDVTGRAKSLQQDELLPRYDFVAVSIGYPRDKLYNRINLRVEKMFEEGLLQEVGNLLSIGVTEASQCMQGIGYKEIAEGLRTGATVAEMKELIKKNTRNYAKRQQTFFRRGENRVFLSPEEATAETVAKSF